MTTHRQWRIPLTIVAAAVLVGCSSGGTKGATTPSRSVQVRSSSAPSSAVASGHPYVGYPDAIVGLGHSGSTGESSDPAKPVGFETRANSWITGTNPKVDSLYLRLVAAHPRSTGHAVLLSRGGARVQDLLGQAAQAVAAHPVNALVVVQIMDNDIVCPAVRSDYDAFQTTLEQALATIDSGLPTSRIFAVSQYGSPTTQWKVLTSAQRREEGGTGPCAFLDPDGQLVPRELIRLEGIIHGYEARLKAACQHFARCSYDGGAFGNAPDRAKYVSPIDVNHFSIAGHAQAAAVAWDAMRKAGLVPATS